MDSTSLVTYKGADLFGPIVGNSMFEGFAPDPATARYVPPIKKDYVFDNVVPLRWLSYAHKREWTRADGASRKGVYFFGPTGSGKTSLIQQFYARLNIPVILISWAGNRKLDDLLTSTGIVLGDTTTIENALPLAANNGWPVIQDELDAAQPDELLGMNPMVETGVITLPNGDVIHAKRGFVSHGTGNTGTIMDVDGIHAGTKSQNVSVVSRYFQCEVGYPDQDAEAAWLAQMVPSAQPELVACVAQGISKIRQAYVGTDNGEERLPAPIRRPQGQDWLEAMMAFEGWRKADPGINLAFETLKGVYGATVMNAYPSAEKVLKEIVDNAFNV